MKQEKNSARQYALYLLGRRDYSYQELLQKLQRKGHAINEIEMILADFSARDLISDKRLTENYIRARGLKGYGPKRIASELQMRGVAEEIVANYLNVADNIWIERAQMIWKKRFKGKIATDFNQQSAHRRYLQYRGFTYEQIQSVLGHADE